MPQELYQELISRLSELRRRRERVAVGIGISRSVTMILLIAIIAIGVESIFHLSIIGRTILFSVSALLAIASLLLLSFAPVAEYMGIRQRASNETLASLIGKRFGEVEDRLVNVLQLARELSEAPVASASFATAAFTSTYSSFRHLDFNAIVDERPLRRSLILMSSMLVFSAGMFLVPGLGFSDAAGRLLHFRTFYQKPAPFVFAVKPGTIKSLRGEAVTIRVRTSGEQLKTLTLRLREGEAGEFERIELKARTLDSSISRGTAMTEFVYELHPQHATEYYVEAREIESEHFTITTLERPVIKTLSITVTPPSYTHQKAVTLQDNFGDISALDGSVAAVSVLSSKPLLSADLIYRPLPEAADSLTPKKNDSITVYHLAVEGMQAKGLLSLRRSGTYHIMLLDKDSIQSEHPIEYTITLAEDEAPAIVLLEPGERAELPSSQHVTMFMKIHDDFGFSSLKLGYRLHASKYGPEEKEYKWITLPLPSYSEQDQEVPYVWNLLPMRLSPEDEVAYVLEVADNDNVTGPHRVRTDEYTVRFPSADEIFKRAEEESNNAERSLKDIKQDAEELQKKVDEVVNEMKQAPTSEIAKRQQEFSRQKDVQDVLKRQQELNNRVADVKKELQQMTDRLSQQNALTPETMEKYMELQKLFEQINSPELKEAMQRLQDAMKNIDQKQLEQAMKNFQFNDEQFRKSIERTANILKKIKMEQKVDELIKRSNDLAKGQEQAAEKQNELAQQNKNLSPEEQSAEQRKQQDAQNELERMKEEAKDLANDMKKLPEQMQAPEEMKEAMEALNDPSMDKSMQDASDASKQNQHQRASKRHQDAADKAKNARNKLSNLKQKLSQNEKQRTIAELKQLRDEMNRLSKAEESLKNSSQSAQPQSNVFRDLADEQADRKEELGNAASQMFQLAQRSPSVSPEMGKSLGEAFSSMQKAMDAMTERDQNGSVSNSRNAMAALNTVAKQTQEAMNSMQNPGNGSCPNPGGMNPGGSDGSGGEGMSMGSGGGGAMQQFLNQINAAAAKQQALNDQMQSMMQGQNGNQSAERQAQQQQAQMARLAAEQGAVKKSIEDLSREQKESDAGRKKAVDDLKKIADEMQDVISDMKTSGVRPETVQRQERILSRLLQAQRSVHERDKDETREAKGANDIVRQSPPDLDPNSEDSRRAIRDDMLNKKESIYSKDYQALIRKYLEKLQK